MNRLSPALVGLLAAADGLQRVPPEAFERAARNGPTVFAGRPRFRGSIRRPPPGDDPRGKLIASPARSA